jgi:hypothetical protein
MEEKEFWEDHLPGWLKDSIRQYRELENTSLWDCGYCGLQSDINVAEVEQLISPEQAWYLREKYLGLTKDWDQMIQDV